MALAGLFPGQANSAVPDRPFPVFGRSCSWAGGTEKRPPRPAAVGSVTLKAPRRAGPFLKCVAENGIVHDGTGAVAVAACLARPGAGKMAHRPRLEKEDKDALRHR